MKKILWVMSRPLAGAFGSSKNNFSGTWLDAAFESCCNLNDIELYIATTGNVSHIMSEKRGHHVLYMLPGGGKKYDENNSSNIQAWIALKHLVKPDIIQIWGTECDCAKIALQTFTDIPSVIYIQGMMDAVARGYDAEIPFKKKLQIITPYDIIHMNWINASQEKYIERAVREKEILNMATAAIVENDWCEDQIHAISPKCMCYRSNLPIKESFWKRNWSFDNVGLHTIFTNAGSMPLKGHHVLLKALHIVKLSFPDFKIYIPGTPLDLKKAGRNFHTPGYSYFLSSLIKQYELQDNIIYVGLLSDTQMAEYLSKVHVFVMPSCVENHSSSLIEAQIVGTPCITSFVGGTGSVVKDGVNALIYNFHDAASLAGHICRIFKSKDLALKLSSGANLYRQKRKNNIGKELLGIYQNLIEK